MSGAAAPADGADENDFADGVLREKVLSNSTISPNVTLWVVGT